MIKYVLESAILWGTAVVYGIYVLFDIIREGFRVGFSNIFHWKELSRPSCLDNPSLGTHGYLRLDQVSIHYVASGPENKPLMLFVHGFPEFWYSWRHQIREFQKDYRVVAIDQRGYGESDKPTGIDEYTVKKLVSDLKQVITALGYKSCILVAHDWGGAVAWCFARLYPDMVDRLIILNVPPAPLFRKVLRKDKTQFKMSWYMFLFQLPYLPELYFKHKNFEVFDTALGGSTERKHAFSGAMKQNPLSEEDVIAYKYTFSRPGAVTPPINYYRAAMRRPEGSVHYDLNYTMPVLLIWGCQDIALSSFFPDLVEGENNPNITVQRIPEAGHFVQMDNPSTVNKLMREWLQGQSS